MTILYNNSNRKPTSSQKAPLISKNKLGEQFKEPPVPICTAKQVVFKPHSQVSALVTSSGTGIPTFQARTLEKNMQTLSAAFRVMDTLPLLAFHILLSNYSAKATHLSNRMAVAYAADTQTAVVISRPSLHQRPPLRTPRE